MKGLGAPVALIFTHAVGGIGGMARAIDQFVGSLRAFGFDPRVVCFHNLGTEPDAPHVLNFSERRVAYLQGRTRWARVVTWFRLLRALWTSIHRLRPVIVCLSWNLDFQLALWVICAWMRTPVVELMLGTHVLCPTATLVRADTGRLCEGGWGIQCLRHCIGLKAWVYSGIESAVARLVRRRARALFIARETTLARDYRRSIPGRWREFPTALLNPPAAAPGPSPLPNEGLEVVYVGRLDEEKGVEDVIDAFALVVGRAPRARLRLIGDGLSRGRIEALVRSRGIETAVSCSGWLEGEALEACLLHSSLAILPSRRRELGPGSLIDLWARGIPCIVSDRCGYADLVRRIGAGEVYGSGDVFALSETVLRYLRFAGVRRRAAERALRYAAELQRGRSWTDHIASEVAGIVRAGAQAGLRPT